MASTPSTLTDEHHELAIDASVLINLLGSGEAEAVLLAVARPIIIASAAYREVKRDPFTGMDAAGIMSTLEDRGLIIRCDLDADGTAHMLDLVSAPGSDALDDGEAATIALATCRRCCVVIDEVRGRRIAARIPIDGGILGTLDILGCQTVEQTLGITRFRAAILNAARASRMRFPVEYGAWAEALLGEEQARTLPGLRAYYRTRRQT